MLELETLRLYLKCDFKRYLDPLCQLRLAADEQNIILMGRTDLRASLAPHDFGDFLQIRTRSSGKEGNWGKAQYPSHPWNKQTNKFECQVIKYLDPICQLRLAADEQNIILTARTDLGASLAPNYYYMHITWQKKAAAFS